MTATNRLSIAEAQRLFDPQPGWLNTASYGLPPRPAWDAMQAALDEWRHGRTSWEGWDESVGRARATFARLIRADVEDVSIGSAVSQQIGLIAASLPDGARVLVPEIEFGSNIFPYQVHAARGVKVRTVPLDALLDSIDDSIDLVAISAVQSATGEVTDLSAVAGRAHAVGALVVADVTQAAGWLPLDAGQVDAMACAGYKWLCGPRGTSFLHVSPQLRDRIRPLAAGWYAGEDVHAHYYGPELDLARGGRRFDLSPAWHCWVGLAPALEVIERVGVEGIHAHDVGLANRFRAGLGMPAGNSAIVSLDHPRAQRLPDAGIRAATRAGSLRVSFHLYSTEVDVDMAVAALTEQV